MTKKIDTTQFQKEVREQKGVTLVDFYATWCGPCRMLAPTLEELSGEGYHIVSVDVDEEQALAAEFGVMSIPTLVFFKDGEKKEQIVGLTPKSMIQEKLNYYSH